VYGEFFIFLFIPKNEFVLQKSGIQVIFFSGFIGTVIFTAFSKNGVVRSESR
jgi:hypothetical protein